MKRPATMLAVLLLAACSNRIAVPNYYLLRGDAGLDSRELRPVSEYALGRISIASYIDQPGLVLETGGGEIRPAREHLWAEPINESLRSFFLQEISRLTGKDLLPVVPGPGIWRINLRIDQLHGTLDGGARLVAYWWLQRGEEVRSAHRFAGDRPLERDGYAALVDAQRTLLSDLAENIAGNLTDGGSVRAATE